MRAVIANDPDFSKFAGPSREHTRDGGSPVAVKAKKFSDALIESGLSSHLSEQAGKLTAVGENHFHEIVSMASTSTIGVILGLKELIENDIREISDLDSGTEEGAAREAMLRHSIAKNVEMLDKLAGSTQRWAKDRAEIELKVKELKAKENGSDGKPLKKAHKAVIVNKTSNENG